MSLILATGSNIGNGPENLQQAKLHLCQHFNLIKESSIYYSQAVDYLEQDHFYNQVLEFSLPQNSPQETLEFIKEIEKKLGRSKTIPKGPRCIDIDIIFWDCLVINRPGLSIPHPLWKNRLFVCGPLQELPFFEFAKINFGPIPHKFDHWAHPLEN